MTTKKDKMIYLCDNTRARLEDLLGVFPDVVQLSDHGGHVRLDHLEGDLRVIHLRVPDTQSLLLT